MDKATFVLIGFLLVVSCVVLVLAAGPMLKPITEAQRMQAETELTEAQTELVEVETFQESQRALSKIVAELLAEIRTERRFQREQLELLVELLRERDKPSYTWLWVLLIVVGGIVAVLFLRRRERVVVVMPPPKVEYPGLSTCSTDVVSWQETSAAQVVEIDQDEREIAIE